MKICGKLGSCTCIVNKAESECFGYVRGLGSRMTIRPFLVTVCGGLAYSEWHNILRTFSEAILTPCVKSVAFRGPIEAEGQVLQA
jgi:hypothetical protein